MLINAPRTQPGETRGSNRPPGIGQMAGAFTCGLRSRPAGESVWWTDSRMIALVPPRLSRRKHLRIGFAPALSADVEEMSRRPDCRLVGAHLE